MRVVYCGLPTRILLLSEHRPIVVRVGPLSVDSRVALLELSRQIDIVDRGLQVIPRKNLLDALVVAIGAV